MTWNCKFKHSSSFIDVWFSLWIWEEYISTFCVKWMIMHGIGIKKKSFKISVLSFWLILTFLLMTLFYSKIVSNLICSLKPHNTLTYRTIKLNYPEMWHFYIENVCCWILSVWKMQLKQFYVKCRTSFVKINIFTKFNRSCCMFDA